MECKSQISLDILRFPVIRSLLKCSWFPLGFQIVALATMIFFIVNGLGVGLDQTPDQLMMLRKTNATTLLVWGIWWPFMILGAFLFGRVWCMVCPMELINRVSGWLGNFFGPRRMVFGSFWRNAWLAVLAYLALQILVSGVSIHRVPHFTALMLITLFAMASFCGLLFGEERSFCKTLCPSKALLSVYGRFTPFQLDIRESTVCEQCTTKDCVNPENRARFDRRSCPSLVRPFGRKMGDECVLCLQCAKVCPKENIGFGFVKKGAGSRELHLLRPFEALFVMIATGFVTHEVVGEMKSMDNFFHWVPEQMNRAFPGIPFGWVEGLWFLVLVPLVFWLFIAIISKVSGSKGTPMELWLAATTGAAPIVVLAHAAKACAKLAAWGGYLPLALSDPQGVKTLARISEKTLALPSAFSGLPSIGWLMVFAMTVMVWHSRRWISQAAVEAKRAMYCSMAICALFYGSILISWAWFK